MGYRDDLRGTGRTQRMLEAVAADPAPVVIIVAHTANYAADLHSRLEEIIKDGRSPRWNEMTRADGRRILFVSMKGNLRGLHGSVHIDHYASETMTYDEWEQVEHLRETRP